MKKMSMGGGVAPSKMGAVKTAAPSRDGVATKGKTKGTQIKMAKGGMMHGGKVKKMNYGGKACWHDALSRDGGDFALKNAHCQA